ncbi:MAG: metallophosphoesterase [Anaerolineales bacterium]|nr:metallophosphoesterase [Anaerolineales bacterium]
MKIAITADVHLTSRELHPQRFQAIENILDQMLARQVSHLVVAGDLFDASLHNYAEFDSLCQREELRQICLHIIPGNHDDTIANKHFLAPNVRIYSQAKFAQIDSQGPGFLFIPYQKDKSMGAAIADFVDEIHAQSWILVGHGDWSDGLFSANPYEAGVYMPLSRKDLARFEPAGVFLGHIHIPFHKGKVYYPGSPCGLNINETGQRRFLIYDTSTSEVESVPISNQEIFFDETIVILPVEDEKEFLISRVMAMISGWGLSQDELDRVCLRIKVKGASADKSAIAQVLHRSLKGIRLYSDPDLSEVYNAGDQARSPIVEAVRMRVEEFEWLRHPDEPSKDDLLIETLAIIYGR